jgi:glycosyltransferase involved in cell wall biosynthesis
MRITFVLDTFRGGGKERRCLQVIQGLNKEGVTDIQVVIVNNDVAYKELYETSARVEIIDRKNRCLSQIQTAKELFQLLKRFCPDIVQAWGIMSAGVVLMVKPFMKFRFIASYVADVVPPKDVNGIINRWCNLACDKIVSNSQAGLTAYNTPESKGVVVYNGFNETRFGNKIDKSVKKSQLDINTPFVVAMVATFWRTKDWQCYIDTAKRIIKQRDDITFLAVGKGPQWDYYNDQIKDEERLLIKMLGRRDDVDELFQICDLTVLCSTHGEALSNSIMESMAWGVPVIASSGGGTPEIIENNVNGILIDEQTSERVEALIIDLIDQPDILAQLSEKAARTVQDGFLLHRMTEEYLKLYKAEEHE